MNKYINMDSQMIAEKMHEAAKEKDFFNYDGDKEKEIKELEEAIYQLKATAENPYNSDYWRALVDTLIAIFQD